MADPPNPGGGAPNPGDPPNPDDPPNPGNPPHNPGRAPENPEEVTPDLLRTKEYSAVCRMPERDHLTDDNWHDWKGCMERIFENCDVNGYVYGEIEQPEKSVSEYGNYNWKKNDMWAQQVILSNVSAAQRNHIRSKKTAAEMFAALRLTHDSQAHTSVNYLQTVIYETKAKEDDDIGKHLDTLKSYRDKINSFPNQAFHIEDIRFKSIISQSLPDSWQQFVEPYNGNAADPHDPDPKRQKSADAFIGLIREEYRIRCTRNNNGANGSVNLANDQKSSSTSTSLQNRISDHKASTRPYCEHCKRPRHWTSKCRKNPANKCYNCGKFGHKAKDCWRKKKKGKEKEKNMDTSNVAEVEEMEEVTFAVIEPVEEEVYNFDTYDVNSTANDERLIYYDWLADSATTSHVTYQRDAFTSYVPTTDLSVTGIGGRVANIAGRGTVDLISTCNGKKYKLRLQDVLHIPDQKYNLISLGRWDAAGGQYNGGKGRLVLTNREGKQVAEGKKMGKHLYKMSLTTDRKGRSTSTTTSDGSTTFLGQEKGLSWETWHKRFGHVGYPSLQKLYERNMVDGFNVNTHTTKPDCVACTEAKQHVEPFPKHTSRQEEPGGLTHIDLWGKYAIRSINGNQYYLLFVDDSRRYVTVNFLKEKTEAAQGVINYLAHLITQGRTPKAIQIDRGKEFVNEKLDKWCKNKGIDIRLTAPYSPSQNGVAERMNRTLVELGRAMLTAQDLPEFLWEYAILHAAYLRNLSYTKRLETLTPYQGWHKRKPNVSHLREFGAPVWILLQGQKEDRKMLPKSKRRSYMGYDEGSKAVKYYNAETGKVLTSRNYRHLNLPQEQEEPEITTLPPHDDQLKGEQSSGRKEMGVTGSDDLTRDLEPIITDSDDITRHPDISGETDKPPERARRKRKRTDDFLTEDVDVNAPRKTRGIRTDYKLLTKSFPVEMDDTDDDEEDIFIATDEAFAIIAGDELTTLREAKASTDWPEWTVAMNEELAMLQEKGTWKLVQKPPGVTPLNNKWTFVKKRNKEGSVIRFKARLVVKGCGQRYGHDYVETFSPVVRMETLRAILALVPILDLQVQQMDVKGAYLNGILQEKVYMRQPEGYGDGTDRVCELIKTMYGLKQSGREWNRQFHERITGHGYRRLLSDPCVYVRRNDQEVGIITVWVDDLLLFATSPSAMQHMKNSLTAEWEVTDLGQPSKIVGIEITLQNQSVTISQTKYIENILEREGMDDANPVGMPMDPHIKLEPNPEHHEPNRSNTFAQRLGELSFLSTSTRPDIAYAVNRLAAYTANPSVQHYTALKRILRYLAGTKNLGIKYTKSQTNNEQNNLFHDYSDSGFANADDGKSISGYVYLASGGAITWRSKKQTIIALSSTEAEYIALSEAGREACWLRNLYGELGFRQQHPTILKGDNEGSCDMTENPQFHQRSKHIALKHHWIRQHVDIKTLDIERIRDADQTADALTKALPNPTFARHVEEMGLRPRT